MEDKKLQNLLKKYNKSENCLYVFAPKCNPEIRQNFTTFYKAMALDYKNLKSFLLKQFMQSQRHVIG